MTHPLMYGEQATVEKYVDGETVKIFVRQTQTVRVKNAKEVLAHFLRGLDRQNAGEIQNLTFECIPFRDGEQINRVKMSWICVETQA